MLPPKPKQAHLTEAEKTAAAFGEAELCAYVDHFWDIDFEMTGFITMANMREFSIREEYEMTNEQLRELIDDKDANQDGKVSLREFVAASHRPMPFDKPWLYAYLYDRMNDGDGFNRNRMRNMLESLEMAFTESQLDGWLAGKAEPLSESDFIQVFLPGYAGR
jgi:hypothetical protein